VNKDSELSQRATKLRAEGDPATGIAIEQAGAT